MLKINVPVIAKYKYKWERTNQRGNKLYFAICVFAEVELLQISQLLKTWNTFKNKMSHGGWQLMVASVIEKNSQ